MKRYTLRGLIHDAKSLSNYGWNTAGLTEISAKIPPPVGCSVT